MDKEAVLKRALKYNSKSGKTIAAINAAFDSGEHPVIAFVKLMVGLPYGDNGMSTDVKADCSQFVINTLYYFYGIDYLGSYTQSMYNAAQKRGVQYGTIAEAPVLSVVLYKLSTRNKNATHAALKVSETEIADTRSKSKPLMIREYAGWYDSKVTCVVDFLTAEQRAEITEDDIMQKGDKGELVKKWQTNLLTVGYTLPKYGADGDFGTETETATNKFKAAVGLEQNGVVDGDTWAAMADMRVDVAKREFEAENERLQTELTKHIKRLQTELTKHIKLLAQCAAGR